MRKCSGWGQGPILALLFSPYSVEMLIWGASKQAEVGPLLWAGRAEWARPLGPEQRAVASPSRPPLSPGLDSQPIRLELGCWQAGPSGIADSESGKEAYLRETPSFQYTALSGHHQSQPLGTCRVPGCAEGTCP